MICNYLIIRDGFLIAIEQSKSCLAHYPGTSYTHWCEEISGTCPKISTTVPFVDPRGYAEKRRCAYMIESDLEYAGYRARVEIDGDDDATAKVDWLAARAAIKAKYPKP